jgi:hypothetical protein
MIYLPDFNYGDVCRACFDTIIEGALFILSLTMRARSRDPKDHLAEALFHVADRLRFALVASKFRPVVGR